MNDLQRQLMERLGVGAPEPVARPAPAAAKPDTELDPDAHLATPWMARLRSVRAPGSPPIPPKPSLQAARQLTDKAAKALKAAGQGRAASELVSERDDFLKRREKQAWSLVKTRFAELDLPERAYRAIKQGEADPEKIWTKLKKANPAELKTMGADRLRDLLA